MIRIPPEKWFPVQKAFKVECDILHFDWPHDWYNGRSAVTKILKQWMYQSGLKKKSNGKLIWTAHNLVAHDSLDHEYEHRMIQKLLDRCDGVMVLSEASKSILLQSYRVPDHTSIRTIRHGHYIDCYPNLTNQNESRLQLKLPKDECIFLSLGSIRPYKGIESLIKRFAEISEPRHRLLVAGVANNNDYASQLKQFAAEYTTSAKGTIDLRLGMVAEADLQHFFNAANVTVLPFEKVLNSGSLMLAMSFGMPVVAPSTGSIPEVAHPLWSFLYDQSSDESLSSALMEAAGKTETKSQDEIRKIIIDFVREKYCWKQIGAELRNWYGRIRTTGSFVDG